MAHGERAQRLSNNGSGRDYNAKRVANKFHCNSPSRRAKHDPKSPKRITRRTERRTEKQQLQTGFTLIELIIVVVIVAVKPRSQSGQPTSPPPTYTPLQRIPPTTGSG